MSASTCAKLIRSIIELVEIKLNRCWRVATCDEMWTSERPWGCSFPKHELVHHGISQIYQLGWSSLNIQLSQPVCVRALGYMNYMRRSVVRLKTETKNEVSDAVNPVASRTKLSLSWVRVNLANFPFECLSVTEQMAGSGTYCRINRSKRPAWWINIILKKEFTISTEPTGVWNLTVCRRCSSTDCSSGTGKKADGRGWVF